ncbi:GGDEF domain-containing protein [Ideonella sp.]|uniref:GGDEF domain-containing protein n=1 Tax=Ideonella sp. TaxID=1929293 RepID=UPI002B4A0F2C|nr:diguanylate cyclase [Ideonella sp.]HJV67979.1 diguanylate cyclase [Ideonella sp.]
MKDAASALTPAQIAKAALRRLALAKLEPTPENYAQAWAEESGEARATGGLPPRAKPLAERIAQRLSDDPAQRAELVQQLLQGQWDEAQRWVERSGESAASQSQAWAQLIERLTRGLERGGKQWTTARKKDSLQRVLDSSRGDMQRLLHRLRQLVGSWDSDEAPSSTMEPGEAQLADAPVAEPWGATPASQDAGAWPDIVAPLQATVQAALPADSARAAELADELKAAADRIAIEGATPELAAETDALCQRARRLLAHRHHLLDQVHQFSRELTEGLTELAEDDSWVQGQVASLRERLAGPPSARAVHSAGLLLAQARMRQRELRGDRDQARDALKELIHRMLAELGQLDQHTGRFSDGMLRYAETIERADSLQSLAGVVREMVDESRAVHGLVSSTRERLAGEHQRATELEQQVRSLEAELRKLSDEVATDVLTQVANRRGLMQAFEAEKSRLERDGGPLAVGLLDIDNFKRLNDSLGHAAGDQALIALAQHVRRSLRPVDVVARFGGEEFVVLLPGTPVDEAQKVLTRLQRELSASLFMHDGKEVFVTFSAGVTPYRLGEKVEEALERADEALYEAKRTGKNRTCIA